MVSLNGLRISPNAQIDLRFELMLLTQYELLGCYVLHDHILVLFQVRQKLNESRLLLAEDLLHSLLVKTLVILEMAQLNILLFLRNQG